MIFDIGFTKKGCNFVVSFISLHAPSGSIIDSETSTPRSIQSPVSPQSPQSPASPAEKMMESATTQPPDFASAISRMGKNPSGKFLMY